MPKQRQLPQPVPLFLSSAQDYPKTLSPVKLRHLIMFYSLHGFDIVLTDSQICDNKSLAKLAGFSSKRFDLPTDFGSLLSNGYLKVALRNNVSDLNAFHETRKAQEVLPPNLPPDIQVQYLNERLPVESILPWDLREVASKFTTNVWDCLDDADLLSEPKVPKTAAKVIRRYVRICRDNGKNVYFAELLKLIDDPFSVSVLKITNTEASALMDSRINLIKRIREAYAFNIPDLLGLPSEVATRSAPITLGIGGGLAPYRFRGVIKKRPVSEVEVRFKDRVINTWSFDPNIVSRVPVEVLISIRGDAFNGKGINKEFAVLLETLNKWRSLAFSPGFQSSSVLQHYVDSLTDDFASCYERYCHELEYVYQQTMNTEVYLKAKKEALKNNTYLAISGILTAASFGFAFIPQSPGLIDLLAKAASFASTGLFVISEPGAWRSAEIKHKVNQLVGTFHPRYENKSAGRYPRLTTPINNQENKSS